MYIPHFMHCPISGQMKYKYIKAVIGSWEEFRKGVNDQYVFTQIVSFGAELIYNPYD